MVDEWARQGSPLRWALRHPGLVAGLHRRTPQVMQAWVAPLALHACTPQRARLSAVTSSCGALREPRRSVSVASASSRLDMLATGELIASRSDMPGVEVGVFFFFFFFFFSSSGGELDSLAGCDA